MNIKRLTTCAVLTALALSLSLFERLVPLGLIIPLPGVKLGLSNLVLLYAVFRLSYADAFFIYACRVLLLFLVTGNITSLAMSGVGGMFALCSMCVCHKYFLKHFSVYGISVCGAVFHNIGQLLAALVITRTPQISALLPILTVSAVVFGNINGFLTKTLLKYLKN